VKLAVAALLLVMAAPPAHADLQLPFARDLLERAAQTPLGTWHEFELAVLPSARAKVRMAMVKKSERAFTIEMSVDQSGQLREPPKVSQVDVALSGKRWRVVRRREREGGKIRTLPVGPEPEAMVPQSDEKSVVTPAGTFACRRHTHKGQDMWLTQSLPLLGLVQLVRNTPVGSITMTLTAIGDGARPTFE
jgi:hypothetical protein